MQKLNAWVENTRIYPPSEMFYQADSKQAKAEKRIVSICEELYVFTCTTLSDMRAAYTELSMAVRKGIFGMRPGLFEANCGKTAFSYGNGVKRLENIHKRDPHFSGFYKKRAY